MVPAFLIAATGSVEHVTRRLEWLGAPEGHAYSVAFVAMAAVVAFVWAFYRRERTDPPLLRWMCAGLRCACLAVVLAIALRPVTVADVSRTVHGRVVVLADASASMTVEDVPGAFADGSMMSRHVAARRILTENGLVAALRARDEVQIAAFDGTTRGLAVLPPADGREDSDLPEWRSGGEATDLAGAVRWAVERSDRPAAIVLLTDGRQTAPGDPLASALAAGESEVPILALPLGSPVRRRNAAVTALEGRDTVMAGMPLKLTASVRADGYAGRDGVLVLLAAPADGGEGVEVARRSVMLPEDGEVLTVELEHVPGIAGSVRYTASLLPLEGEARADDNAVSRTVTISDEELAVLIVAGGASRDYRFVKTLLERDPSYTVTACVHGSAVSAPLPADARELMEYSLVVAFDPAPEQLTAPWTEDLASLIEREGIGLLYAAGPTYAPSLLLSPEADALRGLLPVSFNDARLRALAGSTGYWTTGWPVRAETSARGNPIVASESESDSLASWGSDAAIYWSLPVERAKAGAAVLLRWHSAADPTGAVMAATQPYGRGRVLFCGTPETWRWRQRGVERFRRFWLQSVRYCAAGRLGEARRRARLALDRAVYDIGAPVSVSATLYDERFRPVSEPSVSLAVRRNGEEAGQLVLTPAGEEGAYSGVLYPQSFGGFELIYRAEDGLTGSASFQVQRPEVEFADASADLELLPQLADAAGGSVHGVDDLEALVAAVPDRTAIVTDPGPPLPLWDTPLLMGALLGLLTAEWILRKRLNLL